MTTRAERRQQRTATRARQTRWMAGAGILAIGLVGALVWLSTSANLAPRAPRVSAGRIWGQANAPVAIEIFSDFQ